MGIIANSLLRDILISEVPISDIHNVLSMQDQYSKYSLYGKTIHNFLKENNMPFGWYRVSSKPKHDLSNVVLNAIHNSELKRKKNQEIKDNKKHYLKEGDTLFLKRENCDGFILEDTPYKYIGVVNKLNGVDIDCIIVKKLQNDSDSKVFSLTKNDCKILGIPFQEGLELCSKELPWYTKDKDLQIDK